MVTVMEREQVDSWQAEAMKVRFKALIPGHKVIDQRAEENLAENVSTKTENT